MIAGGAGSLTCSGRGLGGVVDGPLRLPGGGLPGGELSSVEVSKDDRVAGKGAYVERNVGTRFIASLGASVGSTAPAATPPDEPNHARDSPW